MSHEDYIKIDSYVARSIRKAKNRLLTVVIFAVGLFTVLVNLN